MILVTGPAFAGKKAYVQTRFGWDEAALRQHAVLDAKRYSDVAVEAAEAAWQELAPRLPKGLGRGEAREQILMRALAATADKLAEAEVVILDEVGGGVVPLDAGERARREAAGRLGVLLAGRASEVQRVFCGIATRLK